MRLRKVFNQFTMSLLMVFTAIAFIAGCGDNKPESNNGGEMSMTEQGKTAQQQRLGESQSSMSANQRQAQTFETMLSGSNEVPSVDTEASGTVRVVLRGDSAQVKGEFSGLSSDYTASHIHKGSKSENGNPILTLEPEVGSDKTSGSWDGTYKLDEQQISALKADSLYINLHTAENKSGEIRGQLTAASSTSGN